MVLAFEFIASDDYQRNLPWLHCVKCSASTATVIHTTFYIPILIGVPISTPERRQRYSWDSIFGTACTHLIEYFETESQTSELYIKYVRL